MTLEKNYKLGIELPTLFKWQIDAYTIAWVAPIPISYWLKQY
jgi:hypothetical protein